MVIKKFLRDYDFGLHGQFCDAQDLKMALCDMAIPKHLLRVFGHLLNFNPDTYHEVAKLLMTDEKQAQDDSGVEDDDDNFADDQNVSDGLMSTQHFQILYYVHHSGKRRTPMHIMNAESVHSLGRGGKIVTKILNHQGLAVSYDEL